MNVLYITYDGLLDPLGQSQVLPYLTRLAERGVEFTIVSFEKRGRWIGARSRHTVSTRLASLGVRWVPLRYHRSPRLLATGWDLLRGASAVRREARRASATILHCRGDVAMTMARWSLPRRGTSLLYDVRGFFSAERVESGSWPRDGWLDRRVRRMEGRNMKAATAVVVLTESARRALGGGTPSPAIQVIPTCVDLTRFGVKTPVGERALGFVYSGSLGSWYMESEMLRFARVASQTLRLPTLFLTPDGARLRTRALPEGVEVRGAEPEEVAAWLNRANAQFFFYQPTPARRATCPTKLAEGLACGLPVVCNRGIGDLDGLVENERIGAILDDFTDDSYAAAIGRVSGLLADPATRARCKAVARRVFDVEIGVEKYRALYDDMDRLALTGRS